METLFLKCLNISITAGWLVLAVFLFRLIFRKTPKWVFCVLWGLVALRLIIPVTFESKYSLIPSTETIPVDILDSDTPRINSGIAFLNSTVNPLLEKQDNGTVVNLPGTQNDESSQFFTSEPAAYKAVKTPRHWVGIFAKIWAVGFAALLGYALASYIVLKLRLRTAVKAEEAGRKRIYRSEYISDPFVLGIIRPGIYLPFMISEEDLDYVIAHEEAHIKRGDHLWKFLGFVLLSIYWFNPLMWLAYILLCNDIECACDEKVIATLEERERQSYSVALLNSSMAVTRKHIAACPVAFGEVSVKTRIKNVMNYKKPVFWIIIAAFAACIVFTVCFLTNPIKKGKAVETDSNFYEETLYIKDINVSKNVYDLIAKDWEKYDEMDEFQRAVSSHMFGWCSIDFKSWEEMTEFTGVSPANPLESKEWLKKIYVDALRNRELSYKMECYGDRDGNLKNMLLEAIYPIEGGFVDLMINAFNTTKFSAWPANESGSVMSFIVRNPMPTVSSKIIGEAMIVHEDRYDAVRIALPNADDAKYVFCVTSYDGNARLAELVDDMCKTIGLDLTYNVIEQNAHPMTEIPGKDTDYETDYFIDFDSFSTSSIDINYLPTDTGNDLPGTDDAISCLSSEEELQQIIADGLVVLKGTNVISGKESFEAFYEKTSKGEKASILIASYFALRDEESYDPEYYEQIKDKYPTLYIQKIEYDGEYFNSYPVHRINGEYKVYEIIGEDSPAKSWKYLLHDTDIPDSKTANYTSCERYYLANDNTVTWRDIWSSWLSSTAPSAIEADIVYSEYTYK